MNEHSFIVAVKNWTIAINGEVFPFKDTYLDL